MHEKYIDRDRSSRRQIKFLLIGALVASGLLRAWLGPQTLRGPIDAGLLAAWGITGLFAGDRYGLTESRSSGLRVIGASSYWCGHWRCLSQRIGYSSETIRQSLQHCLNAKTGCILTYSSEIRVHQRTERCVNPYVRPSSPLAWSQKMSGFSPLRTIAASSSLASSKSSTRSRRRATSAESR